MESRLTDAYLQHTYAAPELVTCLARYRVPVASDLLPAITHRCTIELPHVVHYCPCRVAWTDNE